MPEPIYTPETCTPTYQLNWSYALFWHNPPAGVSWFEQLQELLDENHIRLLQHEFEQGNVSKFLITTQPHTAPLLIAQRVKGRLQHLIRDALPNAFRRNYSLRSVGSTKREKLEAYVRGQLGYHPMADPRVQEPLHKYQIRNRDIDLSAPRQTSHAQYRHNLHLVLVNNSRWMEVREDTLQGIRDMIVGAARAKGHLLSLGSIVPDHVHLTLGCRLDESPEQVALSYMNNLAHACGMRAIFKFSFFAARIQ